MEQNQRVCASLYSIRCGVNEVKFIPQFSVAVFNAGDFAFIMCLAIHTGNLRSVTIVAEGAPPLQESVKQFCRCVTPWLAVHLMLLAGRKPGRPDGVSSKYQLTPIECGLVDEVLIDVIDAMSQAGLMTS